ncbi:MAG: prolyl oligopeptidase family serine peptidase [Bacteroidales bacterium]
MRRPIYTITLLLLVVILQAQTAKQPLGFDDIESWRRITETVISRDGNYIAYKSEPWAGDPILKVYDRKGSEKVSWNCATGVRFTYDSDFLIFTIKPAYETVRELKISRAKREEMPGDTLAIWAIGGSMEKIPSIRSFRTPSKWGGWLMYQADSKTSQGDRQEKQAKRESATNGYTLYIKNLKDGEVKTFPFVTAYDFATEAQFAYFVSSGDDEGFEPGLYTYDFSKGEINTILPGKGKFRQITFDTKGTMLTFIYNGDDSDKLSNNGSLWYGPVNSSSSEIVTREGIDAPEGWIISENGRLSFSDSGERIFFSTAPANRQKDTIRLEEDYPNVDIWHWNEGVLQTQQVINRTRDSRRSYQAVYNVSAGKVVQLATPEIPDISLINSGDDDLALASTNISYQVESMWSSTPGRTDIWFINLNDGTRDHLKTGFRGRMQTSRGGKYLVWFTAADSSWYTIRLSDKKESRITSPSMINTASETNDVPNPPGSYGIAGWVDDDASVLIYDRYDIWRVDPDGQSAPVRITTNGRENSIVYRMIRLDAEGGALRPNEKIHLSGHNDITRGEGYYTVTISKPGVPSVLLSGDYSLNTPRKAENGNTVVFTRETFLEFADLHVTDTEFRKPVRISDVNAQQKNYNWGTAEVVSWTSLDGIKVEGLLFKPENFDPSKKYPMIVNFYEKSSQGLHSYRNPELHRSTIDYHYYTSNGYLVFNPDVHYRDGYPGESAFNCVMPGVTALIAKGFVDPARIGAQGHSWGGYQVAYMATRTNLFAAIESGAPVVNMFSAYGGIRWQTGLNRAFQYEHQQSRIGASIWETPLRYFENSPLFTMDKVNTPILIMANDQDGHVPWYQGIEYFVALRRLGKPAWMLNYTGEPHWPQKPQNKKDFQIRMAQFFDHFLKGKPMPLWMKEGVPAVDKDFELGYGY